MNFAPQPENHTYGPHADERRYRSSSIKSGTVLSMACFFLPRPLDLKLSMEDDQLSSQKSRLSDSYTHFLTSGKDFRMLTLLHHSVCTPWARVPCVIFSCLFFFLPPPPHLFVHPSCLHLHVPSLLRCFALAFRGGKDAQRSGVSVSPPNDDTPNNYWYTPVRRKCFSYCRHTAIKVVHRVGGDFFFFSNEQRLILRRASRSFFTSPRGLIAG